MTRFLLALLAVGAIFGVSACDHPKENPDDWPYVAPVVPVSPGPPVENPDEEPNVPAPVDDPVESA